MKRQQYITAVRAHITITSLAALLFAGVVVADFTHGVSVKVINDANNQIQVMTYNGQKSDRPVDTTFPHKSYIIYRNGERNVKAHGNGTGEITILIRRAGNVSYCCKDDTGKKWNWQLADDGDTVTIDHCRPVC